MRSAPDRLGGLIREYTQVAYGDTAPDAHGKFLRATRPQTLAARRAQCRHELTSETVWGARERRIASAAAFVSVKPVICWRMPGSCSVP